MSVFFCFGARFFVFVWGVGGWCRLELCQFCKLWQELLMSSGVCKATLPLGLRVLQPNTPFGLRVLKPNTPFRALRCCNPTLLLGPQGLATHSFWGSGVLQPTPFGAVGFCNPTLLLGPWVLQPNTPFRALVMGAHHHRLQSKPLQNSRKSQEAPSMHPEYAINPRRPQEARKS